MGAGVVEAGVVRMSPAQADLAGIGSDRVNPIQLCESGRVRRLRPHLLDRLAVEQYLHLALCQMQDISWCRITAGGEPQTHSQTHSQTGYQVGDQGRCAPEAGQWIQGLVADAALAREVVICTICSLSA